MRRPFRVTEEMYDRKKRVIKRFRTGRDATLWIFDHVGSEAWDDYHVEELVKGKWVRAETKNYLTRKDEERVGIP